MSEKITKTKEKNPLVKQVRGDKHLQLVSQIETPIEDNFLSVPFCVIDITRANSWEQVFQEINTKFEVNPKLGLMLAGVVNKPQLASLFQVGFKPYPMADAPMMCLTRQMYNVSFKPKYLELMSDIQEHIS